MEDRQRNALRVMILGYALWEPRLLVRPDNGDDPRILISAVSVRYETDNGILDERISCDDWFALIDEVGLGAALNQPRISSEG